MIDYEKELNKEQLKVVYEGDGPCLVLSGPGSGKTRTLIYRTSYLLEKGVSPYRIMLLTFTKRAAEEMIFRISNIFPGIKGKMSSGTFHHAGNYFLRKYSSKIGYAGNFVIIDKEDSKSILSEIIKEVGKDGVPKAQIIQNIISLSVNSKKKVEDIIQEYFPYFDFILSQKISNIAEMYKLRKKENNLMDYDDLLLNWNEILSISEIQEELSERFQYVLIDEYQDTNIIQDEIVHKISKKHKNILVVGDDAQSIYSFRAANIDNILNFPKRYSDCKIFKLETNYRSTPEILSSANEVIKNNEKKLEKKLRSIKKEGSKPSIIPFSGPSDQARFIKEYANNNINNLSDIAVLFRAHFHSVELELELAREGIPYVMRGGMRFIEQFHIKDVMAFLKLFVNVHDETSWKRLLMRLEGVGEVSANKIIKRILKKNSIKEVLEDKNELIEFTSSNKIRKNIEDFFFILEDNIDNDVSEKIVNFQRDFYNTYLDFSFENAKERKNDLKKIEEISEKYDNLEEMISDFSLSEDFKKDEDLNKNAITLSTVHQAKGLEWKSVFIISMREGDFPHLRSMEEDLLEEERRLFYVAITRCKEELFLTYPIYNVRDKESSIPSRFLKEIDSNLKCGNYFNDEEIVEDENEWEDF